MPASPISPTGNADGLNKRHSWNGNREETLGESISTNNAVGLGLSSTGSGGRLSLPGSGSVMEPEEEHDHGTGYQRTRHQPQPSFSTAHYPSYYFHQDQRDHPRPYFHQFNSEASLEGESSSGHETPPEDEGEDAQRLTFAPPPPGSAHRRQPSRAYDEQGNPRASGVGARMADAVSRNPTLRSVSRTIRKASVRVVNIVGAENDGRVRLEDEEIEDDELRNKPLEQAVDAIEQPGVPPRPPERLRGKTLGIFGPRSRIRRSMDALLRFP